MKQMAKMVLVAGMLSWVFAANALAGDPSGTWIAGNGKSHVKMYKCGAGYCGKVIRLREPNDNNGQPKLDRHNKNASLRTRKIIGIKIMTGMKPTKKEDQWKGKIYNPEDGKTYTAFMKLQGDAKLKVEGCVAGIFCKSQSWSRVK